MKLIGSEIFKVHKDSITGIALLTYGSPSTPFLAESAVISTCSKDSSLKVVNATSISNRNINFSLKRTFSGTNSPFSSCTVTKDGKFLYASSLDNNLYHYSIQNACVVGKKQGHDDGISCIDMDSKGKLLVTGSWDATVKVFELKENSLPSKSLPPFYMDNGCVSISIDDSSRYVAAGAEDGCVIVWDLKKMNVEFTYQLSHGGMMVSCVKWFPHAISQVFHNQGNFNSIKLICSSIDGSIACIDVTGRVFAGARFEYGINALETDGRAIYGGLEDGSLRVWAMESGRLREVFRLPKAHSEVISSLKIDYNRGILVSGASDGTIRLWNIVVT
jgi:WD40 repeat protein